MHTIFRRGIVLATVLTVAACSEDESTAPTVPDLSTTTSAVLVGAGEIARCGTVKAGDAATARLLDGIAGTVFTIGDNAYPDGSGSNYSNCYGPTWGRYKSRTRPVPGNHDYHIAGAAGYFGYFGSRAGSPSRGCYSFQLGTWHVIAINSEANLSAEATWLKADLAAHPARCTLAYWHRPLFTSGPHGPATQMRPIFRILYQAGAEVVVTGHNHNYERFAPQTPDGNLDAGRGIREFVVGTGGAGLYAFDTRAANSQARYSGGHGVIKLTLNPGSYSWKFIPVPGKTWTDSGSQSCH
jgi:hypothetical protein